MNITRNVIADLLPVYLSGEASPDTAALIEEFLRQDPDFAGTVEVQKREFASQKDLLEPAAGPSADHELRTLSRTSSLMERQKWLLAVALMMTALPFSFAWDRGHLVFMLVRDQPTIAAAAWLGAAIWWILYFAGRSRLRVAGLLGRGKKRGKA